MLAATRAGSKNGMSALRFLSTMIEDLESQLGVTADSVKNAAKATVPPTPPSKSAPSTNAKKDGSEKKKNAPKKEKKEKKEKGNNKKAPAGPVADEGLEFMRLDIRVGQIVDVWKHETADKLYCEKIDVGEEEPRSIASGLVPHYSLEEMQNKRILVVCNLKARNLVGFKSHGMVLCAASEGDAKVEFVSPPADAKIGERVVLGGDVAAAAAPIPAWSAAQVDKKKVFPAIAQDLRTTGEKIATWQGHPLVTAAGECRAPTVVNGAIR